MQAVNRPLGAVRSGDHNSHVAAHDDEIAVRVARDVLVAEADRAFEARLDEGRIRDLSRTADVEGTHGELRARLADGLRRDDADSLAVVDRGAPGQVAAVAGGADAVLRLADEHGTDLHLLDAGSADRLEVLLFDHRALRNDDGAVLGNQILSRRAAEDARSQRRDHLAGIDDGAHLDAPLGAAIRLTDDRVLRHVDEAAGQVARVRRLERGVGQALTGAVGRVEVLENVEAFLEVRDDRRLDDLAGRLGHEAAHRRELLHLGRRTTGARVGHHVDRVDRLVAAVLVLLHRGDAVHHLAGEAVRALRPGVDDLVVLLALGDEAVLVLLLVVLREGAGLLDDLPLVLRDHHVVLAERDAGLERVVEARGP